MSITNIASYRSEKLIADHNLYSSVGNFPSHIHDAYELLFLTRGAATYTVEGKAYPLSTGSLVITRPMNVHSITFHAPMEYERYDILFDADILSSDICARLPAKLDVLHFSGNTIVFDLFSKIDYYCKNLSGDELKTVLMHLIEEILINIRLASRDKQEHSQYTANPFIKQATKYIDLHMTEPLTVEDVCRELHVTQSYLLHLFNKHLNISPKKYIMSKRLVMAQIAIRSGTKPVDAYKQCGFCDYSTFFRAYKNYFGYAPSDEAHQEFLRDINS